MQDLLTMLTLIRRPRLLVRAARHGATEYRRERHLARLLGYGSLPRTAPALLRLMEIEAAQDEARRTECTSYCVTRHLDVLIAMMGEASLLREAQNPAFGAERPG